MVMLDRLLKKLHERGHRVVLFSQYTRTLDIICDYLGTYGCMYCIRNCMYVWCMYCMYVFMSVTMYEKLYCTVCAYVCMCIYKICILIYLSECMYVYVCMYVFYLKPNITTLIDMREYNFCRLDGSTHRVMREVTMHTHIHTYIHTIFTLRKYFHIYIHT